MAPFGHFPLASLCLALIHGSDRKSKNLHVSGKMKFLIRGNVLLQLDKIYCSKI